MIAGVYATLCVFVHVAHAYKVQLRKRKWNLCIHCKNYFLLKLFLWVSLFSRSTIKLPLVKAFSRLFSQVTWLLSIFVIFNFDKINKNLLCLLPLSFLLSNMHTAVVADSKGTAWPCFPYKCTTLGQGSRKIVSNS